MLRTIVGVIVGYLVMAICVFLAMVAAYNVLGEEWAFQTGSYRVSMGWVAVMLGVGFVAALIGGVICRVFAGKPKPALVVLAVVIVVLGGLDAAMRLARPAPTAEELMRTEATPVLEAASKAQSPTWMGAANPAAGLAGVLLAGALGSKRRPDGGPSDS